MTNNRIAIIVSFCSLLIAYSVNEFNLSQLKNAGIELREGQTVQTNDDVSYLRPFVINAQLGVLYRNEFEKHESIVRLPGYGIMYSVIAKIVGLNNALQYLKYFQLFLFSLSVYCLFFVSLKILTKQKLALLVVLIYGLLPFSMGFLYYTLTEGITPALLIFYCFFLLKAAGSFSTRAKQINYFFASIIFSYLFLTRPFLGIFGCAFPFFLFFDFYDKKKIVKLPIYFIVYGLISISLMLMWQVRNYKLIGRISGLNPIYQNELPGIFRKPHEAIWDFFKGWESVGANFHQTIVPFWDSAIHGDTTDAPIQKVMSHIPLEVKNYFSEKRLHKVFRKYRLSVFSEKNYLDNHTLLPSELSDIEQEVVNDFNCLADEYKKHFWFTYHILTPLKVYKNLTFHSNLSLYVFQTTYRGNFFMEVLRWLCYLLHASLFFLSLFFIFFNKKVQHLFLFGFPLLLYVFYLIYVQRGIEERYSLPILSFVIICGLFVASKCKSKILF